MLIKVASDDRCKILISSLQVTIKILYLGKSFLKQCTNKIHAMLMLLVTKKILYIGWSFLKQYTNKILSLSTIPLVLGHLVVMKYLSGHFAWD